MSIKDIIASWKSRSQPRTPGWSRLQLEDERRSGWIQLQAADEQSMKRKKARWHRDYVDSKEPPIWVRVLGRKKR